MQILVFPMLIFFILTSLLFWTSYSATVIVDTSSALTNRTVHVGDTIIFSHKYHYNLYIFRNQIAFNLCNITQATVLSKQNSTSFTWHPSRFGFFYFTFTNGSLKTCQDSRKLAVQVTSVAAPPENSMPQMPPNAAPPGSDSGNGNETGSTFPWPSLPHQASSPAVLPSVNGGLVPFINSNPAVPLPGTHVDSATANPLPISSQSWKVMVEFQIAFISGMVIYLWLHWTSL